MRQAIAPSANRPMVLFAACNVAARAAAAGRKRPWSRNAAELAERSGVDGKAHIDD
jgi:hypothetical protein